MKNIRILLITFLLFVSCAGLKDAGKVLRNEKITTTDEFLVKKKDPLVLPPDYDKIPEPGTISKRKIDEEDKIKNILNAPKVENEKKQSSSIEESIINQIRK